MQFGFALNWPQARIFAPRPQALDFWPFLGSCQGPLVQAFEVDYRIRYC